MCAQAVKSGASIMATDREGKIVGLRLGELLRKEKVLSDKKSMDWLGRTVPFCLWSMMFGKLAHVPRLWEEVGYRPDQAFDQLECEVIYGDVAVSVKKVSR